MNLRNKVEHVRHQRGLITIFALSLFVSSPALAQGDGDDDKAKHERMLALSEKASEAFQNENYEDAARLFAKARAAHYDVLLTMNEMIAWYKAGKCDEAMEASSMFLKEAPNDPKDEQNQSDRLSAHRVSFKCHVQKGEDALASGNRDDAIRFVGMAEGVYNSHKAGFEDDDKASLDALSAGIESAGKTPPDDKVIEDPIEAPVTSSDGGLTAIGWTGVGGLVGGAVLLGVGGAIFSQNYEAVRPCSAEKLPDETCMLSEPELDEKRGTVQTQQIVMVAGGALAAVGAGLLIYDLVSGGESDSTQARVVPVVGADGGGVQVLFSF